MSSTSVRSLGLPIVIGTITVLFTVAMLVGWTWVLAENLAAAREVAQNTTLLVAGIISFIVIMSLVITLSVFLGREILEVHRQNTFIDSVTHELKSPLASLKLCLETQARPDVLPAQQKELRDMMLADVDRLSVFIDDILEASRIAHGRRGHQLDRVELDALVRRCAEGMARRYKLEATAIRIEVPPGLSLTTDATALETVVKNLLDNALKYSDEPRRVDVSARSEPQGGVELSVRDFGIGIPKQHLGRIFDRFYRVPDNAVNARRGTGLGLYVVAALVKSLGGRLSASSEGQGRGATLTVWLRAEPATRTS
jgi:signal transduction histidine kinase